MRIMLSSRIRLCFAVVVKITDYYHCVSRWVRSITVRIAGHVYIVHNSTQPIRDICIQTTSRKPRKPYCDRMLYQGVTNTFNCELQLIRASARPIWLFRNDSRKGHSVFSLDLILQQYYCKNLIIVSNIQGDR